MIEPEMALLPSSDMGQPRFSPLCGSSCHHAVRAGTAFFDSVLRQADFESLVGLWKAPSRELAIPMLYKYFRTQRKSSNTPSSGEWTCKQSTSDTSQKRSLNAL